MDIRFPPDVFIRDRIFQPMVDAFHIDPKVAKWSCFRFMAIGLAIGLGTALIVMISREGPHQRYIMLLVGFYLAAYVSFVTQIWLQIVAPPYIALRPTATYARMSWLLFCAVMILGCVHEIVSPEGTLMGRLVMFGITASWHVGVTGGYLNICRRPPPPRDDRSRRLSFVGH